MSEDWQAQYRAKIEQALEQAVPSVGGELYAGVIDAMRYSLLGGGKRIRPLLVMEFCRLCGGNPEDALPWGMRAGDDPHVFLDPRRSSVYG